MLSLTLFNVYLADLEEEFKKVREGEVVIGRKNIWSLIYADDIVLMATVKKGLKDEKIQETPREEKNDVEHRKVEDNDFWERRRKKEK